MLVWHGLDGQSEDIKRVFMQRLGMFGYKIPLPTPEQVRLYGPDATIAMAYIDEAKQRHEVNLPFLSITRIPPLTPDITKLSVINSQIERLTADTLKYLDDVVIEHCPNLTVLPKFPLRPFKRILILNNPKLPLTIMFRGGDWRDVITSINAYVTEAELAGIMSHVKV